MKLRFPGYTLQPNENIGSSKLNEYSFDDRHFRMRSVDLSDKLAITVVYFIVKLCVHSKKIKDLYTLHPHVPTWHMGWVTYSNLSRGSEGLIGPCVCVGVAAVCLIDQ